jgi:hypothetical protein
MELKPKLPTLRSMMFSGAIIFGAFAVANMLRHDLGTGLWSFAVCLALVLGLLPPWLTGHTIVEHAVKPDKYNLFGE